MHAAGGHALVACRRVNPARQPARLVHAEILGTIRITAVGLHAGHQRVGVALVAPEPGTVLLRQRLRLEHLHHHQRLAGAVENVLQLRAIGIAKGGRRALAGPAIAAPVQAIVALDRPRAGAPEGIVDHRLAVAGALPLRTGRLPRLD